MTICINGSINLYSCSKEIPLVIEQKINKLLVPVSNIFFISFFQYLKKTQSLNILNRKTPLEKIMYITIIPPTPNFSTHMITITRKVFNLMSQNMF